LGNKLIAEYHPDNGAGTGKYYYHMADQINSTRIITDDSNTVVHSAAYGPFGETQKTWTNTYEPKLKFSGKERESYSGLDYFGARYYDHSSYRFNSVDPIRNKDEALTNPQLWNLYSYCRNSPITYLDPDGKLERTKKGKIAFKCAKNNRGGRKTGYTTHKGTGKKGKVFPGTIRTNDGSIEVQASYSQNKKFKTNCIGYVFADGQYWIQPHEVPKILKGDGYSQVTGNISPGDVAVYSDSKSGEIVHATIVREVSSGGVIVEGLGGLSKKSARTNLKKSWNKPAHVRFYRK